MIKRILVYGDSITWGRIATKFTRYDEQTRYTRVLQHELGEGYEVIEEGLRGRRLHGDTATTAERDGLKQFGPILASQFPVDILIIFLGTNDCSLPADTNPEQITAGLPKYFDEIAQWTSDFKTNVPTVLIVSPPIIQDTYAAKAEPHFVGGEVKSAALASLYQQVAQQKSAQFFDAATVVKTCKADGIHLDAEANITLGRALAQKIKTLA